MAKFARLYDADMNLLLKIKNCVVDAVNSYTVIHKISAHYGNFSDVHLPLTIQCVNVEPYKTTICYTSGHYLTITAQINKC